MAQSVEALKAYAGGEAVSAYIAEVSEPLKCYHVASVSLLVD